MAPGFQDIMKVAAQKAAEIELTELQRSQKFLKEMFKMATTKKKLDPQDQAVRDLQRMAQLQQKHDRYWRKLRRALTELDKIEAAMKRVGKRKPAKDGEA
jgi:multidrug resistance efflux pump